jgi:serine/threonine protein phosphatase PrpC
VEDQLQKRIERFLGENAAIRSNFGTGAIAVGTNRGPVRSDNQDRALVVRADYGDEPERNFLLGVVCDGLGGMLRGQDGATVALSCFISRVLRASRMPAMERLKIAVQAANDEVYKLLYGKGGATLSAVMVQVNGSCLGVNVGDSRIYSINGSQELLQISQDDNLAHLLNPNHPNAMRNSSRLTQFVGIGEGLEPHVLPIDPSTKTILITSDGIHSSNKETLSEVVRSATPDELVDRLLNLSEILGGRDNATAVTMPITPAENHAGRHAGLNLTFWSSEKSLEIWIPVLSDGRTSSQTELSTSLREASQSAVTVDNKKQRQNENSPPMRKRKRKKSGSHDEKQTLPFDDAEKSPLKVDFSDKAE